MACVKAELRTRRRAPGSGQFLVAVCLLFAGCAPASIAVAQPRASADSPTATKAFDPGPTIDLDYAYYEVKGRDAAEVLLSLRRNGPRSGDETFFGITRSQTGFSYQLVFDGRSCRLQELGVLTKIVVELPKWKQPHNTPDEITRQWRDFMKKLTAHEMWHAEASRRGTFEVYQALLPMTDSTCDRLDARAKAEVQRISTLIEQRNKEYDQLTDHGRKDGIVWHY